MHSFLKELSSGVTFKDSEHLNKVHDYKNKALQNLHKMRLYSFVEVVQKLIDTGVITRFDSAIDIGSNRGIYSKLISEFGFKKVKGIDIEESYVELAKANFESHTPGAEIHYFTENAENINREEKYDFILCTEVIEHTANQEKMIENFKYILNKGGVAVITLPNVISLPYILTWISYKLHRRPFNQEMKDHLSYPFYKTINLFKNKPHKLIQTSGTNLFYWHFLHKFPGFNTLNKFNYNLGKLWPFKFFNQFFYIVIKNE